MLKFFESDKKSLANKKQILIKLIEKIEKIKPDDYELLEDIKLEIQEDVPLSSHKKNYLKDCLHMLKQNKNHFIQNPSIQKQTKIQISDSEISKKISDISVQRIRADKTVNLEQIKTTIKNINAETTELKKLVKNFESLSDMSRLRQRYDKTQEMLDNATTNLYSMQSSIYDRLQEIQRIKNDLAEIREILESKQTRSN